MIECPKCKSTNWKCWDEQLEWFKQPASKEDYDHGDAVKNGYLYFEYPVGYLKCTDCGQSYIHSDASEFEDTIYVGDEREFNRDFYGYDPDDEDYI